MLKVIDMCSDHNAFVWGHREVVKGTEVDLWVSGDEEREVKRVQEECC